MRRTAVLVGVLACVIASVAWGATLRTSRWSPRHTPLHVSGWVNAPLYPGAARPLNLRVVNRRGTPLLITRLHIRARVLDRPGCSRREFAFRPIARASYPIWVPAHSALRLRQLGVSPLPRARMKDLARNQDACKDVRLRLQYRVWSRLP